MNILNIVKAVVAWSAFVTGIVCCFVAMPYAIPAFACSIAASLLPTSA